MDLDSIYLIILGITVVSYLLGLFLSHFERREKVSIVADAGNGAFINIFGAQTQASQQVEFSQQFSQQVQQVQEQHQHEQKNIYFDEEII